MQVATIVEQLRPLVQALNHEERVELIHSITLLAAGRQGTKQLEPDLLESELTPDESSVEDEEDAQLQAEQAAWFARPKVERQLYQGQYVAVYQRQVVDHDPERRALYLRVRKRFGLTSVLLVHADWDAVPKLTVHSASGFIRPANRQALALLETWTTEPEDHDKVWWDELESELRENRFSLKRPE